MTPPETNSPWYLALTMKMAHPKEASNNSDASVFFCPRLSPCRAKKNAHK